MPFFQRCKDGKCVVQLSFAGKASGFKQTVGCSGEGGYHDKGFTGNALCDDSAGTINGDRVFYRRAAKLHYNHQARITYTNWHLSLIHISEPTRQAEISY